MRIYHYDRNTGEYTGEDEARLDPMEAKKGVTRYLVPANATTEAPKKAADGQVSVYKDGGWVHSPVIVIGNEKIPEINLTKEEKKEALIQGEMAAILREQAIERLEKRGKI